MDALGLAFGAVGALSQVLECFEYVYVARTFNEDYQIYQLKLENARLRLSRWAAAVNLESASKQEQDQAEKILRQIYNLFERTKQLSDEFAQKHYISEDIDDQEAQVMSEMRGLGRIRAALHEKMRNISLKRGRQPSNSTFKKSKWAIYSKEHMASLTGHLTTLTTELVELFPIAKNEQKKLGEIEMLDFLESIRVLREVIGDQDTILAEELNGVLKPAVSKRNFSASVRHSASQILS